MCGSIDSELLTPAFLSDGSVCRFQEIRICRKCGLVYKNPVIPDLNTTRYHKLSWGDGVEFKKRIADLILYLDNYLMALAPKTIMEIGPGPGWLAMCLQTRFPESKLILFEASDDVAQLTKQNLPKATVIPSTIDQITMREGLMDLIFVCGVDYLFCDFKKTIDQIYSFVEA